MKQLFRYVASILFLSSIHISYAQVVAPIPTWVEHEDISTIRDVDAKTIKGGYFYLVIDEQFNTTAKQSFFHYATKVVSAAGLESASQIEIGFGPSYQRVQIHYNNVGLLY